MLRKRIIFTLIYSEGYFMQSRNFRLQKVGNAEWLERNYKFQNIAFAIDELIILNATRGSKDVLKFSSTLSTIINSVFIPIAAGGGISSMEDASTLFKNGADKLVLNTVLLKNPLLVSELADKYGSQSLVASVDYKKVNGEHKAFINNGNEIVNMSIIEYIEYISSLNVGEIYLNSIDKDGTGFGYDKETILTIGKETNLPLIIAGGAGNENHLMEGLKMNTVNAVATANLFNFIGDGLPNARKKILQNGENIADWNF